MTSHRTPAVVAHCDWSKDARKRWMTVATRSDARWTIGLPEPVGETATLLDRLKKRSTRNDALVLGFDFPIGWPRKYAEKTCFTDFKAALACLGHGDWSEWFDVCTDRTQIDVSRPFYPNTPGGRKRAHLLDGLGVNAADDLMRRCDRKTDTRPAACCLFWTLGGNQVGKGAITGWKEVLQPNIHTAAIWPFDGDMKTLLRTHPVVIAETYPGDAYAQIGIGRRPAWSKRKQTGRASVSAPILARMNLRGHERLAEMDALVTSGFSSGAEGEDQFDSTVGLLSMLDVIDEHRAEGTPKDPDIMQWEGWILGQA